MSYIIKSICIPVSDNLYISSSVTNIDLMDETFGTKSLYHLELGKVKPTEMRQYICNTLSDR